MKTYVVQVRQLPANATPADKPRPLPSFSVAAETTVAAKAQTAAHLERGGFKLRSLSFNTKGGISAVVVG